MLKQPMKYFLAISFVLVVSNSTMAQGGKTQPNNTSNQNATSATKPATPSEREQDGFIGPVRRVKTEVAKLANKGGKFIEGQRALLENSAYDMSGVKSEYSYYPNVLTAMDITGRETYKYDDKGNISEMTLFNADGSLAKKEVYTYEYDFLGNWVKQSTSVAVIEGGKLNYEPTEVTYRTISYYMDADVMAKMEAFQKAQTANTQASNTTATPTPTSSPANTQPQSNSQGMTKADTQPANSNATNTNHAPNNSTPANTNSTPANNDAKPTTSASTSNNDKKVEDKKADDKKVDDSAKSQPVAANNNPSTSTNVELPKAAPKPILRPVSGGVLNGKAVNLPVPDYPDFAKRSGIGGLVTVEVVIDENGKVISAKAIGGPSMLQKAAENAALRARFSPTLLTGQPVKVTGVINYNFAVR